jgi:hypothetical protein
MDQTSKQSKRLEAIKEINLVKKKNKLSIKVTNQELLIFYFNNFYKFIGKETRIEVINRVYDLLRLVAKEYMIDMTNNDKDYEIEATFVKIAQLIYRTSPIKQNIFYMLNQYIQLFVKGNNALNKRIMNEIEELMFNVNKFTQLYYKGDGRGQIIYINLYEKEKF